MAQPDRGLFITRSRKETTFRRRRHPRTSETYRQEMMKLCRSLNSKKGKPREEQSPETTRGVTASTRNVRNRKSVEAESRRAVGGGGGGGGDGESRPPGVRRGAPGRSWNQTVARVPQHREGTTSFTLKWLSSRPANFVLAQLCFLLLHKKTRSVLLRAAAQSPGLNWPHLLTRHSLVPQRLPRWPVSVCLLPASALKPPAL